MKANSKNSLLSGLTLLLATVIFLLLGCEGIVRMLHLAPEVAYIEKWRYRLASNPRIGFEPIPDLNSQDVDVQYYSYRGKSNNLGFRDETHEVKKPEDVFRVLILGDSVALGLWINDDSQIFSSILEDVLKKEEKKFEILNFSVAGYNTLQEVETLKEKGLSYSPDLVVLAYCQNDRERDDGGIYQTLLAEERTGDKISSNRLIPYFARSALYRLLAFRIFKPDLRANLTNQQARDWEAIQSETVENSLTTLALLSREHSFKTLVVLFPKFMPDGRSLEHTSELDKLTLATKQNDLGFFDLSTAFKDCSLRNPATMAYDAFHLTPEGHQCAGDALAEHLLNNLRR